MKIRLILQMLFICFILLLPVITLTQTVAKYRIIGSGEDGYQDGGRKSASFSRPMGIIQLEYHNRACLMISDAGNHLIRLFDIVGGTVSRIAGKPGLRTLDCAN